MHSGNYNATFDVESHAIGTGGVTGTQYETYGTSHLTYTMGPRHIFEEVDNFRIVGQGPDNGVAMPNRNPLHQRERRGPVEDNSFSLGCA